LATSLDSCEPDFLIAGVSARRRWDSSVFFDAEKRLVAAKGDPPEMIDRVVPLKPSPRRSRRLCGRRLAKRRDNAGRKPIDLLVMFRMFVLQSLYNLSDEQLEHQLPDRSSFTRFLRIGFEEHSGWHGAVIVP
jgi:transposase, IS5 family